MPSAALSALRKAARGLMYMSEKDAPFKAIAWEAPARLGKKKVLEVTGHDATTPIEEVTLDDFFRGHVTLKKWHAADDKALVKRFQVLVQSIQERLRDVRVYKVGGPKIDAYIVGKDEAGNWVGLATQALET